MNSSPPLSIRVMEPADVPAVEQFMSDHWGGTMMISRGKAHHIADLSGFVAWRDDTIVGLATFAVDGRSCELVSIDALASGEGLGSLLLTAAEDEARRRGCERLWLITTNDNLQALRFFQRRGLELVTVHRNAIRFARALKPAIPLVGHFGIPIRDEIELEKSLKMPNPC